MKSSNLILWLVIITGALMVTGTINSAPNAEPCTANDKLLDIIKDQQKKISDMLVVSITEANKAKQEAMEARKKYEEKYEELRNKPCVK